MNNNNNFPNLTLNDLAEMAKQQNDLPVSNTFGDPFAVQNNAFSSPFAAQNNAFGSPFPAQNNAFGSPFPVQNNAFGSPIKICPPDDRVDRDYWFDNDCEDEDFEEDDFFEEEFIEDDLFDDEFIEDDDLLDEEDFFAPDSFPDPNIIVMDLINDQALHTTFLNLSLENYARICEGNMRIVGADNWKALEYHMNNFIVKG